MHTHRQEHIHTHTHTSEHNGVKEIWSVPDDIKATEKMQGSRKDGGKAGKQSDVYDLPTEIHVIPYSYLGALLLLFFSL